jgi:hypothetical protein
MTMTNEETIKEKLKTIKETGITLTVRKGCLSKNKDNSFMVYLWNLPEGVKPTGVVDHNNRNLFYLSQNDNGRWKLELGIQHLRMKNKFRTTNGKLETMLKKVISFSKELLEVEAIL